MSYTINKYSGSAVATVADGTVDATLDIKLIGKNYAGYGEIQNENFVHLLENFASPTPGPSRPIAGQLWFDTTNSKLKFYDGSKFRTTGGAEISSTQPTGLSVGDFWFDTTNNQLYAKNESGTYTLIGPQGVAGVQTTQLRSRSVTDTSGNTHPVIEAINNGQTIFIISVDAEFTLNNAVNQITGFTKVQKGVTLCYTNNDSLPGQTTSDHRFWGTATNADRLGGLSASAFVQTGAAVFSSLVNFSDAGYTVGNPVAKLKVYNDAATTPTIENQSGDTIVFKTTVSSVTRTPLKLVGNDLLPGSTLTSDIGSTSLNFNNIYANYLYGTAEESDKILVGAEYRSADVEATINTVAARDSSGALKASLFMGVATEARYADLAEKYLADSEYEVGTVLMVGGDKEVTACQVGFRAVGPVSEKPAHLMNSQLEGGTAVALKGRVPVKVSGPVLKGQRLVAGPNGTAQAAMGNNADVFAIALESNDNTDVKLVEALVL